MNTNRRPVVDAFTYLSVLLSIIIGLGMTQVLTGLGRLIRGRSAVVVYWPPLLWAGLLLIIYVQAWWSMFSLRNYVAWTFLTFLVVLLQTIALYMMAAVVLPEDSEPGSLDLLLHYRRQSTWFFSFFGAAVLISVAKEEVLSGRLPEPLNLAFHCLLLAISAVAIITRKDRHHQILALFSAASIGAYVALLYWRLP